MSLNAEIDFGISYSDGWLIFIFCFSKHAQRQQRRCPKTWHLWRRYLVGRVTRSLRLKRWLSLLRSFTTQTPSSSSWQTCRRSTLRCHNTFLQVFLCKFRLTSVATTPSPRASPAGSLHLFFSVSQGKKDVVHLFSNIVRRQIGTRVPTVEYISSKPEILFMLLRGWVALPPHATCVSGLWTESEH